MARLKIPYESLDPLTIGSADDESKIYREELELEVPDENLLAAIYPEEPEPVANATDAARESLDNPVSGPSFRSLVQGGKSVAIVIDNQFRPTPTSSRRWGGRTSTGCSAAGSGSSRTSRATRTPTPTSA